MKIKLELNSQDIIDLNNSPSEVIELAHKMLEEAFRRKDESLKCSIIIEDKD